MRDVKPDVQLEAAELLALARLSFERGDLEDALLKTKTILQEPNPPAAAMALGGRIYAQLGLFEQAARLFSRYLESEPGSELETFQLGMVRFDQGQREQSIKIWDELLERNPTHPPALFYKALAQSNMGDLADARHALEILLQSASEDNFYRQRATELLSAMEGDSASRVDAAAATRNQSEAGHDPYKLVN